MQLPTLYEWLTKIGSVHQKEIDLGLDRVKMVAERLGVLHPECPVIIVGGTNGKGSTVAGLEAIYLAAGYQTGAFTSPIIFKHNEQVRVNGKEASDQQFCEAFAAIEKARGEMTLTPFEFHTLAALLIFNSQPLSVWILEVGLGGRLDAVNILDADVSVVTSVSLDHTDYLGPTREHIGFEKAGIFRTNHPAVCGDPEPPQSLLDYARSINASLYIQGQEFGYHEENNVWEWLGGGKSLKALPRNALDCQNMSCVLMVVNLLQSKLNVSIDDIKTGLQTVKLTGRIEIISGDVTEIRDVSHNQASVGLLAKKLHKLPCQGKTYAVFSMLADKDILSSVLEMKPLVDEWFVAPLQDKRAASIDLLQKIFEEAGITKINYFDDIQKAYAIAKRKTVRNDRIVVFGSFRTIAEVVKAN